jgi:hypothetical protein
MCRRSAKRGIALSRAGRRFVNPRRGELYAMSWFYGVMV